VVAGVAGIEMFIEGKKVKKVEGVPPKVEQIIQDEEAITTNKHTQKSVGKRREKNKSEDLTDEKEISPKQ
jgi:hypothetical protein